MMHFTERVMTAERCTNNTSSFTYRKIDEALMTKNVIITKQPYSYMLINNQHHRMFQDPNTEKCAVLIITPHYIQACMHAHTHIYTAANSCPGAPGIPVKVDQGLLN